MFTRLLEHQQNAWTNPEGKFEVMCACSLQASCKRSSVSTQAGPGIFQSQSFVAASTQVTKVRKTAYAHSYRSVPSEFNFRYTITITSNNTHVCKYKHVYTNERKKWKRKIPTDWCRFVMEKKYNFRKANEIFHNLPKR